MNSYQDNKIFQPNRTMCHTIEYCNNKCNEYILDIKVSYIVNFTLFLIAFWTIELLFKIVYDLCVYCLCKTKNIVDTNETKNDKKITNNFILNVGKSTFQTALKNLNRSKSDDIKWVRKNNRLKRI